MKNKTFHLIIFICGIITFIIPLVQLSIGFHYVVKDGQSARQHCAAAPDLPLLMAMGGVFTLFFLGIAYGLIQMLSSINNQQSDIAGKMPKFLVGMCCFLSIRISQIWFFFSSGLITFLFGSIAFIFFILIQIRVYDVYSTPIQYQMESVLISCQSIISRSAFILIILTYISLLLFLASALLLLIHGYYKKHNRSYNEFEMKNIPENTRF